jgi:dipeptidyl aminopeptidase/acylaminoacyl peptidase
VNLQDAGTQQQIPLSPGASQRLSRQCWSPDGTRLLVTEFTDDHSRLLVYDLEDNTIVQIAEPDVRHGCFHPITGQILLITDTALRLLDADEYQTVAELNLSSLASVRQTFSGSAVTFADADVVCFLGRDSTYYRWRVNQSCDVMLRETHISSVDIPAHQRDDYTFQASDGLTIPVQRYLPDAPNGAAVMFLEGGPGLRIDPRNPIVRTLLEAGYEVIRPAYRGCDGYGEAHLQANQNEYGRADVRDVVECGIDWRQRFNQPDAPLAVSGYSYGGYLTFLALAQVDDGLWTCGITFWGCTMIPAMSRRYGLPDDPAEYDRALQERSPVRQAHRIRSPLLILHGERDTTSSIDDVQTICRQARMCESIIFEGETHALHGCRPQMYRHMLDFLRTHMRASANSQWSPPHNRT